MPKAKVTLVTPSAENGAPVSGYNVDRSLTPGGSQTRIASNVSLPYEDTTVAFGTDYFYKCAGVNSAGAGPQSAEVTVSIQAAPTASFATPTVSVTEGDTGTVTVANVLNVARRGVIGDLIFTLTYGGTATSGVDYATPPTSITVPGGSSSVSFNLIINSDVLVEASETLDVTATNSENAITATKNITIANDDVAPTRTAFIKAGFNNQENVSLPSYTAQTGDINAVFTRKTGNASEGARMTADGKVASIYAGSIPFAIGSAIPANKYKYDLEIDVLRRTYGNVVQYVTYLGLTSDFLNGIQIMTWQGGGQFFVRVSRVVAGAATQMANLNYTMALDTAYRYKIKVRGTAGAQLLDVSVGPIDGSADVVVCTGLSVPTLVLEGNKFGFEILDNGAGSFRPTQGLQLDQFDVYEVA